MPEWLALMPRGQQAQKGAEVVSYCQQSADLLNVIDPFEDPNRPARMRCTCDPDKLRIYNDSLRQGGGGALTGAAMAMPEEEVKVEAYSLLQAGRPRYAVTSDHPNHFVDPDDQKKAVIATA